MDYKARFYSPYINHFIQPDSIIPNPANPQSLNRYGYVGNSPVRFSDPTGHKETDDLMGGGTPCLVGDLACQLSKTSDNNKNGDSGDEDDEIFSPQIQDITAYAPTINPFQNPFGVEEYVIYCQNNICDIRIGNIPGEYRFDWRKIDLYGLSLDLGSLTLSVMSLPPVTNTVGINTDLKKQALQSLNSATTSTSTFHSIETRDGMGLYLTGVGLILPQLNIPSSVGAVINDLSKGFYFVPMPPCIPLQYKPIIP